MGCNETDKQWKIGKLYKTCVPPGKRGKEEVNVKLRRPIPGDQECTSGDETRLLGGGPALTPVSRKRYVFLAISAGDEPWGGEKGLKGTD